MQFTTEDCATLTHDSVSVHAEHKLLPTKPHTAGEIKLGPLDELVAPFIPVAVLYLYRHEPGQPETIPVRALRSALEHTLSIYPQLAGRLCCDEATGARSIVSLDAGATLLEAGCSRPLGDFAIAREAGSVLPQYSLLRLPTGGNAFFAPFSPDLAMMSTQPVCTVQHTRFTCGSVALGIRILHTLVDAGAFVQFVTDTATVYGQLALGAEVVLPPTGVGRAFRLSRPDSAEEAGERNEVLHHPPPFMHLAGSREADAFDEWRRRSGAPQVPSPTATCGRELYFTADALAKLREGCKLHSVGKPTAVTVFQALTAFLYTHIYAAKLACVRAAGGDNALQEQNPPTTYLLSINIRHLLAKWDPAVCRADRYFGNGVYAPCIHLPVPLARGGSVAEVAAALHEYLTAGFPAEEESVKNMLRWVCAVPRRQDIRTTFLSGGFMASAWNRFNLYGGATFDGARPVLVTTPFTPISLVDNLCYLLPLNGDEGERGLIVYLALAQVTWCQLAHDEEFMKFVAL